MRLRIVISGVLMTLCSAVCLADMPPIVHDFNAMNMEPRTISFSNSNKTGTTDFVTYKCCRNAVFGADLYNPAGYKVIAINMTSTDDSVTISPALVDIERIRIWSYPSNKANTNIQVHLSTDGGRTWSDAISGDNISYRSTGIIEATLPSGEYLVKLRTTNGDDVSIYKIEYHFAPCNCFPYVSE